MTRLTIIISMFFLLGLMACAGSGSQGPNSHPGPESMDRPAALPLLPDEDPMPAVRSTSLIVSQTVEGDDPFSTNGQVIPTSGTSLAGQTEPGLLFAMYRLEGLAADLQVDRLDLVLESLDLGEQYFAAIADYSAGRWQILPFDAEVAAGNVELGTVFDPARHVSPAGTAYVALLVSGADALVRSLILDASIELQAPTGFIATDGSFLSYILLSWDATTLAASYDIFYKLDSEPDTEYELLASVNDDGEAVQNFEHREDTPVGKESAFEQVYEYRVRAVNGLESSTFSEPDTGFRAISAPRLFATRQGRAFGVSLVLFMVELPEDATVDIFRDGEALVTDLPMPSNILFRLDNFLETIDPPGGDSQYTAIVSSPLGSGPLSEPVTGSGGYWDPGEVDSLNDNGAFHADMAPDLDPALDGPAVCYRVAGAFDSLRYRVMDDTAPVEIEISDAETDMICAMRNHGGRPWVAYHRVDDTGPTQGLYIARGSSANPADGGSFDSVLLHPSEIIGRHIKLEVIDGRLACMFLSEVAAGIVALGYSYALVDDPQLPTDWVNRLVVFGSPGLDVPDLFDFTDIEGVPAGCWLTDEGVSFFRATDSTPASEDDFSHGLIRDNPGSLVSQGIDVVEQGGVLHAAYLLGADQKNGELGYLLAPSALPGKKEVWQDELIASFTDDPLTGVALIMIDEGLPLIALSDNATDYPRLYSRHLDNADNAFNVWSVGPLLPNTDLFSHLPQSRSEPRLILHDSRIRIMYDYVISASQNDTLLVRSLAPKTP